MLKPCDLRLTGLIVAISDRVLPPAYREACIAELAARIDHTKVAERRVNVKQVIVDLTNEAEQPAEGAIAV